MKFGHQALEKRMFSHDEFWVSNVPAKDNKYKLLARAGRQVQEVYLDDESGPRGRKEVGAKSTRPRPLSLTCNRV